MPFMHSLNFYLKMKTGLGKSDRITLVLSSHNSAQPLLENLCSYWLNDLQGFVGHKEDLSIGMCFLIPM